MKFLSSLFFIFFYWQIWNDLYNRLKAPEAPLMYTGRVLKVTLKMSEKVPKLINNHNWYFSSDLVFISMGQGGGRLHPLKKLKRFFESHWLNLTTIIIAYPENFESPSYARLLIVALRVSVHETLMFAASKPEGQLKLTLMVAWKQPYGLLSWGKICKSLQTLQETFTTFTSLQLGTRKDTSKVLCS